MPKPIPPERLVGLADAAEQIARAISEGTVRTNPYCLIMGAGVSTPAVPAARAMIEEFKSILHQRGRSVDQDEDPPVFESTMEEYSYNFSEAKPNPVDRQQYLREKIEKSPVSHANLRLAHLLLSKEQRLTNVVLTTNFDDFLFRALRLFGEKASVVDHAEITHLVNLREAEIKIIHVHGTYQYYDCSNLKGEVQARPMQQLVREILNGHTPIIVGYSGWEGDVLMSELKTKLYSHYIGENENNPRTLARNILWFCYKHDSLQGLPPWLRDHGNVRFVVPNKDRSRELAGEPPVELASPPKDQPLMMLLGYADTASYDETLPATQVFESFIKELKLGEPELFQNPLGYFSKALRNYLPPDAPSQFPKRVYFINRLSRQIAEMEDAWKRSVEPIDGAEDVFKSLRGCQHGEAVQKASVIVAKLKADDFSQLVELRRRSPDLRIQLRDLMDAVWAACLGLSDANSEEIQIIGYGLVYELGRLIQDWLGVIGPLGREDDEMLRMNALTLFYKGLKFAEQKQHEKALREFELAEKTALERPVTHPLSSSIQLNQAVMHHLLGETEKAMKIYNDIIGAEGAGSNPELKTKAKLNLALLLRSDQPDQSVALFEEVMNSAGEVSSSWFREAKQMSTFFSNELRRPARRSRT